MSGDFDPASDEAPSTYRVCFDSTLSTVALVVTPKDATGRILAAARGWVLSRRGVRAVHDHSDDAKRILLCPDSLKAAGVEPTSISALPDLPRALADALQPVSTGSVALTLVPASFAVTAHSYTMDQILAKLLPSNVVVPSGFEQIGHIAHLNLQDAQLPYKRLIGQVLLDCNRSAGVRTVVHKLEIASQFRELKLELLAGEDNLVATVRQHGITFKVPFDKVYWNSKLSREHERLIEDIRAGDVLFDVMAGIGPFVIPALRKGATVYGNDLNPASVEAMIDNVKTNTTVAQQAKFTSSCEDGRAFVRRIRRDVLSKGPDPHGALRHFAMNLPALAVTFLDAFSGNEWHDDEDARVVHDRTFRVHCYCFSKTNDPAAAEKDAVKQCSVNLGFNLVQGVDVHAVHIVRDVAPNKLMVCVSFSLPSAVFDAPPRRQHRKEA